MKTRLDEFVKRHVSMESVKPDVDGKRDEKRSTGVTLREARADPARPATGADALDIFSRTPPERPCPTCGGCEFWWQHTPGSALYVAICSTCGGGPGPSLEPGATAGLLASVSVKRPARRCSVETDRLIAEARGIGLTLLILGETMLQVYGEEGHRALADALGARADEVVFGIRDAQRALTGERPNLTAGFILRPLPPPEIDPYAAEASATECPACRTSSWWRQHGRAWVCGTCHPEVTPDVRDA
jgi:ribosomal protein S27AE